MTLSQWLSYRGYRTDDALAISVGTDGFSLEKNNLMSISCTGLKPKQDVGTVYIQGADANAQLSDGRNLPEITGVSPEVYERHAIDIGDAQLKINEAKNNSKFLVMYSSNFTNKWLSEKFRIFLGMPYIDVNVIVKALDAKVPYPSVGSIKEMSSELASRTRYIRGGYTFSAICSRFTPGYDGDCEDAYLVGSSPLLERQPYRLIALYKTLLGAEL